MQYCGVTLKTATAGLLLAAFTMMAGMPAGAESTNQPPSQPASATKPKKIENSLNLAFIKSPSTKTNADTRKGLKMLRSTLNRRTSIHPDGVVGIDIEKDNIILFPFVYWPITHNTPPLSEQAQQKVQTYINAGGILLLDVREKKLLKKTLGHVQIKPLIPIDQDHTLTKSYYLLPGLPGSSHFGKTWVEKKNPNENDYVSSVIIGDGNWAGAWAGVTTPENSRDREMALRAGVNMIMYALTGNYKSDQIHVPSILERLGR